MKLPGPWRLTFACLASSVVSLLLVQSAFARQASQAPDQVFMVGNDVSAPQLLQGTFTTSNAKDCEGTLSGKVGFSIIVDERGRPRNIIFTKALATDLDRLALSVVEADRFKPAMRANTPVAVGQSVEVDLSACAQRQKAVRGQGEYRLHLRGQPVQTFENDRDLHGKFRLTPESDASTKLDYRKVPYFNPGKGESAPILLVAPAIEPGKQALKSDLSGTWIITLVVDEHGLPENAHVVRSSGRRIDPYLLIAVSEYRYRPAIKDGEPVPRMTAVEVKFKAGTSSRR